eukprot:scaffold17236_cov41-Prasinocladus_malaysianus.AAC.1
MLAALPGPGPALAPEARSSTIVTMPCAHLGISGVATCLSTGTRRIFDLSSAGASQHPPGTA